MPSASPHTCSPPTHEPTPGWWRRWPPLQPAPSDRGAPDAAVRYLRRALDEPPSTDSRPALLAQLGRAEIRAAMPDDAVEHLRAAMAATDSPNERALMAHDLAIGLIAPGRYEEAVEMIDQALESAGDVDPELRRRLEAELLCAARLDAGTLAIARRVHDRAAGRHPRRHAGRTDAARRARPRAGPARGDGDQVRTLAARALDGGLIAEQTGDSGLVMDAGFAIVTAGDLERADRCWDEALADVRRRGSVIGFARTSCLRAMLRLAQGRLPDGESEARNAIEVAWEPGYRVARMAHGAARRGARRPRRDSTRPTPRSPPPGSTATSPTATCSTSSSSHGASCASPKAATPQAIIDLEELGRRETKWRGRNPAVFPYRSLLALAGVPDAARLAAEEVRLARAWGAAGALGRALRVQGLVTGDLDRLHESVTVLDGSPCRLEQAQSLIELGAATRRSGHRSAAREPLHAGMELAHACAARTTRRKGEDGALGERLPSPSSGPQRARRPHRHRAPDGGDGRRAA